MDEEITFYGEGICQHPSPSPATGAHTSNILPLNFLWMKNMAAGVKAGGDYSVVMGALDVRDLSCSGTRVASTRHSRAATYVLQLMPMHFSWTEIRHWGFFE